MSHLQESGGGRLEVIGLFYLFYTKSLSFLLKSPLVAVLVAASWLQGAESHGQRFEDYPVTDIFTGTPLGPEHPGGLHNVEKKTNFAGHYMVVAWAPGGDHLIIDVFDTKTGQVFPKPLFPKRFMDKYNSVPTNPLWFGGAEFRFNSRLMVLERACPTDGFQHFLQYFFLGCSKYYFVWENGVFRLVR